MTLELFDRFDMGNPGTGNNTGYFATGNFVAAPAQADGCNWRVSGNNGQTSIVLYYERFDVVFSRVARRDNNQFLLARVDPLLETNTGSLYGLDADTAFSGDGIYVDQYDLVGDTQPFYLVIGGQAGPVREVDPLNTANVLNADVFPGYQPAGNGLSSPTLGHFSSVGDVVFFRGLGTGGLALHCRGNANTDGVAAEKDFVRSLLHGNHRGLGKYDAPSAHTDERIGRPQVDSHVVGKHAHDTVDHPFSCSRRRRASTLSLVRVELVEFTLGETPAKEGLSSSRKPAQ